MRGPAWLARRPRPAPPIPAEPCLTLDEARPLIEAEIGRRGWERFDHRTYSRARTPQGEQWHCQGFVSGMRGGVMLVCIDARTGAVTRAAAGGR